MMVSNGEFIMVYELDFHQGSLKYLKSMSLQGYKKIVGIYHDRKNKYFLLASEDGSINFFTDRFMFFHKKIDLIWNRLTAVDFISNDRIIAGFESGDIQYIELGGTNFEIKNYSVFKFGNMSITNLSVFRKQIAADLKFKGFKNNFNTTDMRSETIPEMNNTGMVSPKRTTG